MFTSLWRATPHHLKSARTPSFGPFSMARSVQSMAVTSPAHALHMNVQFFETAKGFMSQNCLFACSFDFKFIYSYTGWEGSATDAWIYEAAQVEGLVIPVGKYFLVTALPGRQGFRDSMKRSRLGCYTGSSVWGRVKGFQGSRWQRSGCQGVLGVQGGFQGSRRDFGRLLTKSSLGPNWSYESVYIQAVQSAW